MLLPIDVVLRALRREYTHFLPLLADANTQASGAVAAGHAIDLLVQRAEGGVSQLRSQAKELRGAATALAARLGPGPTATALEQLAGSLADFSPSSLENGEASLRDAMVRFEAVVAADPSALADGQAAVALTEWESAALLAEMPAAAKDAGDRTAITRDRLEAYLRDRFQDPGLAVSAFRPLPGGFGKETILFAAEGTALSGEYVLRRDPGANQSLTNDCHAVMLEYPVMRATFERGFPAPDALWLDTDHALLPGGDFIVMRKSPGEMGGNFFGATTKASPELADALADITARLHTLEPLRELGDLASFLRTDLWDLTRGEATRRYIAGWREYYLAESHTPSPALLAIYGWLLANVPDRSGPAALVHGDIGFHNFLFEDGRLTAVLDWEFAHICDPAEELGYIAVTTGPALDWPAFMAAYEAAGGDPINAATLHYFKVWAYARNASASNILWTRFSDGLIDDLKVSILPYHHFPHFIRGAATLIAEGIV